MIKARFIISIITILLFQGCSKTIPTENDIVGKWVNSDNAKLEFNADGTFDGESLPGEKIFFPSEEFKNKRFNGNGKWTLKEGQGWWEITLNFKQVSTRKDGFHTKILISGSGGFLENNPPWYLFVWEGEEGGQRYKFSKE